jgi:hypothetical protein
MVIQLLQYWTTFRSINEANSRQWILIKSNSYKKTCGNIFSTTQLVQLINNGSPEWVELIKGEMNNDAACLPGGGM